MFSLPYTTFPKKLNLGLTITLLLTACATPTPTTIKDSAPAKPKNLSNIPDAVPQYEEKSKYGNPFTYEVFGKRYQVKESSKNHKETGYASWYGTKFHGRRTSSGDTYDMYEMTAAHKTLPLPTYARVTNLENGKTAIVKINDRGPFHGERIIDLSYAAAHKLGFLDKGTSMVEVTALTNPGERLDHIELRQPPTLIVDPPSRKQPFEQPKTQLAQTNLKLLQVGAYSSQESAQQIVNQINALGHSEVTIKPIQTSNQTLYKVHVGPFQDLDSLEKAKATLAELSESPLMVVSAD